MPLIGNTSLSWTTILAGSEESHGKAGAFREGIRGSGEKRFGWRDKCLGREQEHSQADLSPLPPK